MMMSLFDLLTTLNACHGPSGDEQEMREKITQLASSYADEMSSDPMGNLIVHRKGIGPKLMFSAHMDSIGLIVTHFEARGYLRFGKLGGVSPQEVLYHRVRFKNGTRGVILKDEKAEFAKLKMDDLLLDIGADSEENAKAMVCLGDTAIYDGTPHMLGAEYVVSPYLDNHISCAVLLEALERVKRPANDLYFVFSTQEEVGLRGAKTASYAIAPDYGIAVDVTSTDDVPGSDHSGTTRLGKGAAVKIMDSTVICHPQMIARIERTAKEHSISTQREVMRGGGTDAGTIHLTRGGVLTGGISIPCRYIHTPAEMASLTDARFCVSLITALCERSMEEG